MGATLKGIGVAKGKGRGRCTGGRRVTAGGDRRGLGRGDSVEGGVGVMVQLRGGGARQFHKSTYLNILIMNKSWLSNSILRSIRFK